MKRQRDSLRTLQRSFAAALRHPERASRRGAPARMSVYAEAYEARLIEVLEGDYPATRTWLTGDAFARLARAYVRAHPSRHPNLNRFGAHFPSFLRRQRGGSPFAASLARLELAVTRAFDAPAAGVLAMAIPDAPPAITARTRLGLHPSVQLLRLPAAVVDCFEAWRAGKAGRPNGFAEPTGSVDLLIVRTADQVMQRRLPRVAATVLRALRNGRPLGAALAGVAVGDPVAAWFERWRAAGVFATIGDAAGPLGRHDARPE